MSAPRERPRVRSSRAPSGFSPSTAFLWTVTVALLVIVWSVIAALAQIWNHWSYGIMVSVYGIVVTVIGAAVGLLMGLTNMDSWRRGALGFATGSVGTAAGTVISVPITVALDPAGPQLEVIPLAVAIFAGFFSSIAGSACAFGSVLGGVLRGRQSKAVAV